MPLTGPLVPHPAAANSAPSPRLAAIVPMRPGETAWTGVVAALAALPPGSELIFATPEPPARPLTCTSDDLSHLRIAWVKTPLGRARQMNLAAACATADHLWFVHADTHIDQHGVRALLRSLAGPAALHYFDLAFEGGSPLMALNRVGVWLRARLLGLPFGDQAFCLSRAAFVRLGGFDESAAYGEDHLLVWAAARAGLPLRRVHATVKTSARKYVEHGWIKTTVRHVTLTYKQALPQWWRTRTKKSV